MVVDNGDDGSRDDGYVIIAVVIDGNSGACGRVTVVVGLMLLESTPPMRPTRRTRLRSMVVFVVERDALVVVVVPTEVLLDTAIAAERLSGLLLWFMIVGGGGSTEDVCTVMGCGLSCW